MSRVAERALGVAPSVQPLGVPMFAPEPAGRGMAAPEEVWLDDASTAPSVSAHEDGPLPPDSPHRAQPQPFHAVSPMPGSSHPAQAPNPLTHDPAVDLPPAPPARSAGPTNWLGALLGQRAPGSTVGDAIPSQAADTAARVIGQAGPAVPTGPARRDVVDRKPASAAIGQPHPAPGVIRPRMMVRAEAREAPRQQEDVSSASVSGNSAAPTIQVTIGRIEVRAITPAAPAPRAAPARPTPSLSLDQYLKQRNGGRQ